MLSPEDRAALQSFVDKSPPGSPYLRRARILLMGDAGTPPELAANQVGVSITQARNLLRAYKRQGLNVFPLELLREPPPFSPDDAITEAGRVILARELERMMAHAEAVQANAKVTAVHEMRKSIRRMRTALKLLAPYFEPGLLAAYRRQFRKIMHSSGPARDAAVFLEKLEQFVNEGGFSAGEERALAELVACWQERKASADQAAQNYLARHRCQAFLAEFARFTSTAGDGAVYFDDPLLPVKVRHVVPVLIYQWLATIRTFHDHLDPSSLDQMHRLRILAKQMRYILQFFEPVLGTPTAELITTVKQIQKHLGTLNDARVALEMLAQTPAGESLSLAIGLYQPAKETEIGRLTDAFAPIWQEFDQPAWRQKLATAVAVL